MKLKKKSKKNNIIMWDDVNLWLGKIEKDSVENVKEDLYKLSMEYLEVKNRPHFTSAYESLRDVHNETAFLMGLLNIVFRLERLEK